MTCILADFSACRNIRYRKSLSIFYSAVSFMTTFGFLAVIYISLGNDAVVLVAFALFLLYLVLFLAYISDIWLQLTQTFLSFRV